jgi:hypothetical protein
MLAMDDGIEWKFKDGKRKLEVITSAPNARTFALQRPKLPFFNGIIRVTIVTASIMPYGIESKHEK